jgi:hypothetical protein
LIRDTITLVLLVWLLVSLGHKGVVMSKSNKIQTVSDARQYAERYIEHGIGMLAHALNACDDNKIPYRFGDVERERLKDIALELITIVNSGKVELITNIEDDPVHEYNLSKYAMAG